VVQGRVSINGKCYYHIYWKTRFLPFTGYKVVRQFLRWVLLMMPRLALNSSSVSVSQVTRRTGRCHSAWPDATSSLKFKLEVTFYKKSLSCPLPALWCEVSLFIRVPSAAVTRCSRLGGLNIRHVFSRTSGGWKFEMSVLAEASLWISGRILPASSWLPGDSQQALVLFTLGLSHSSVSLVLHLCLHTAFFSMDITKGRIKVLPDDLILTWLYQ
jgi:hypothetical protein